jgi:endonuclease/exonuclease/phosphatase family metal-dependent hydrolase
VGLLLRTWNLFHGNTVPPQRQAYLEEMVRLAAADEPDVVLLQEVPAWALPRLAEWSGMQSFGALASRPPLGAELGGRITDLHHGRLRSAVSGQANAILVARRRRVLVDETIVLNPLRFRTATARALELPAGARLAWAKERRVAQAVRLPELLVANLHATSNPDERLPAAELVRAATWLEAIAAPDEPIALAGDFNLRAPDLTEWGFESAGGADVDHVLLRGLSSGPVERWPEERRTLDGRLLSDHAPLEVTIG